MFFRKKEAGDANYLIVYSLAFSSAMLLLYIFLIYYGIRDFNVGMKIAALIILGISMAVAIAIALINFFSSPDQYLSFDE